MWEVERKKSKGREASQEMPGCSDCTSRDSWSLAQPLESPRQGLWTWVGIVPARQHEFLTQALDARVGFLFCLAGFLPWTPSGQMKVALYCGHSFLLAIMIWCSSQPPPHFFFTVLRTVYSADILIIQTGLIKSRLSQT